MFKFNLRSVPARLFARQYVSLKRPAGPVPLPKEHWKEFEQLQRQAADAPDSHLAVAPNTDEFEGDVNPKTGERGGPKQDPLKHGDYSFNGRVTDF